MWSGFGCVRLRCFVSQEGKEERGHGERVKGHGGTVGRQAGEEQRESCIYELKPLMAYALTQAELLHVDCLSQFIPVSRLVNNTVKNSSSCEILQFLA